MYQEHLTFSPHLQGMFHYLYRVGRFDRKGML